MLIMNGLLWRKASSSPFFRWSRSHVSTIVFQLFLLGKINTPLFSVNSITTGLPQAATLTLYHDSNNNGAVDAADVQIGTTAITVTTGTP